MDGWLIDWLKRTISIYAGTVVQDAICTSIYRFCHRMQHVACCQWRIQGGANPAMAPPFNLVIEFGPPPLKKIKMVLKNVLNIHTLIMMINFTCCYLFEMFASDMHQNEWFQVWFFKNFLGRGSPSPLPRPLPPFFLGLRPRFGLRPQFSGASRLRLGRFAPSIRAPPSTFGRRTWFGPPKINCWIRHCVLHANQSNYLYTCGEF